MLAKLVLLFVGIPLVELALLIFLGDKLGIVPTIALVVVTGVLGASLARQQGTATWSRFREAMNEGRLPHEELVEGILILVAGAVLLTPGLLTDLAGFSLLLPPLRRRIRHWLTERLKKKFVVPNAGFKNWDGGVIDVDYVPADDDPPTE